MTSSRKCLPRQTLRITPPWIGSRVPGQETTRQAPKAEELSPANRPKYFGNTKLKDGKMIKFLRDDLKQLKEDVEGGEKAFHRLIETLAAESHRQPGTKPAKEQLQLFEDFTCTSSGCHEFHGTGKVGMAPD